MSKLLLTSKGLSSSHIETIFLELLDKPVEQMSICIIPTASFELKEHSPRIIQAKEQFARLGFLQVDCLDIEFEPAMPLLNYDILYIGGGDPFYLLKHLWKSGADQLIEKMFHAGKVIVGVSAGTLVLGPHLEVAEVFTPELRSVTEIQGLGLFSFSVMPHADREDLFPNRLSIETRLGLLEKQLGEPIIRLKDEDILLIQDEEALLLP